MIKPYFLATTHKREKKEPRNPTRDRGVVRNLRIWLQKKTAKIFMNKAEYVGCATCVLTRGVSSIRVLFRALGGASSET